jgi:cell division protein FtsI (penicillin-binding protein 3)
VQVVDDDLHLQALEYADQEMPDVRGMGIRDALYILENRGVKVRFQGAGKVKSQHPLPGTKPADQSISLVLN